MRTWFYIRIAKNGGKSVKHAVAKFPNVVYLTAWKKFYNLHSDLKLENPDHGYFTVVRNPYERAVSIWRYAAVGPDRKYVKNWGIDKDITFIDFLSQVKAARSGMELSRGLIPYMGDSDKKRSFPEWLVEHTNSQLGVIKSFTNLDDVDFMLRLEHVYEDKAMLEAVLGGTLRIPHRNKNRGDREYMRFFNDKTTSLSFDLWGDDFKYLNILYNLGLE